MRANGFTRTDYVFTGWNTKANGSGTAYAAGASYKAAANLTLYAQWDVNGYVLKWTSALSSQGSYLGTGSITGSASNEGGKRIVYTNTSGQTTYANPYQAGSIIIKKGTAVTIQMVAGKAKVSDIRIYAGGELQSSDGGEFGYNFNFLSASYKPSNSYTFTIIEDQVYYQDPHDHPESRMYYWWVRLN